MGEEEKAKLQRNFAQQEKIAKVLTVQSPEKERDLKLAFIAKTITGLKRMNEHKPEFRAFFKSQKANRNANQKEFVKPFHDVVQAHVNNDAEITQRIFSLENKGPSTTGYRTSMNRLDKLRTATETRLTNARATLETVREHHNLRHPKQIDYLKP